MHSMKLRDFMKAAITNNAPYEDLGITTSPGAASNEATDACSDVQANLDTLVAIITTALVQESTASFSSTRNLGYFAQSGIGTTSTPGGFKCARDIGFLIDSVSTDVFTGGNIYSREFILEYFDENGDPISNGLYEEELQSLYAFIGAGEYMKDAITNQLYTKDLGITSGPAQYGGAGGDIAVLESGNELACIDVQANIDNLIGIVTTVVGLGTEATASTVTETINYGYFAPSVAGVGTTSSPGGFKCARDTGFFIDAVSTDLFIRGNVYSDDFALKYFNADGTALTNGVLGEEGPSVTAFESAGEYMKDAVTNQLYVKDVGISSGPATYVGGGTSVPVLRSGNALACVDVQDNIDALVGIVTVAVGLGTTASLPTSTGTVDYGEYNLNVGVSSISPGGLVCARDTGFFIDAVATDMFTGGNAYALGFLRNYFEEAAGFTPTDVTYDPATGVSTFTVGAHPLVAGDIVFIDKESVTFTCAMDSNATEHNLPGIGQSAYTTGLEIISSTPTDLHC